MQAADIPEETGARRDLVVIGASAGGVEALSQAVRDLPADLAAAVCIVLHIAPGSPSMLAQIWRARESFRVGRPGTVTTCTRG